MAFRLLDGVRIDAIAEERAVSRHTVCNQVKAILSKTGTNSQSELVKLLLDLQPR